MLGAIWMPAPTNPMSGACSNTWMLVKPSFASARAQARPPMPVIDVQQLIALQAQSLHLTRADYAYFQVLRRFGHFHSVSEHIGLLLWSKAGHREHKRYFRNYYIYSDGYNKVLTAEEQKVFPIRPSPQNPTSRRAWRCRYCDSVLLYCRPRKYTELKGKDPENQCQILHA